MSKLPQLPKAIQVDVTKGESGVLLVNLPEYTVFTEADTLNELFNQVNDLIYAFFDVPSEYQDKICYIPPRSVQADLVRIAEQKTTKKLSEFNVTPHYDISIINEVHV
jgi:hypothetical protein